MSSPGGAPLGGLGSTMASLEAGGWMAAWPGGNSSPGLNQSALSWGGMAGAAGSGVVEANISMVTARPGGGVSRGGLKEKNWPALLILVIIALTVGGNIMVILAVSLEKKLQNATNFFLRSLAVADILVGILVMPVSLINILYDYAWPLPSALCPIWIYLDVLFSTASIMHLCTISLDRYVAIKNPIEHSRFNSRTKAMMKIVAVWTISIGISMPIPVIGLLNEEKVFVDGKCVLNEVHFMLVGSFVAFFIPLVIMVVTYCLTIQVLQRQASTFLYEGKETSQQPLQPPPTPSNPSGPHPRSSFLIPQINTPESNPPSTTVAAEKQDPPLTPVPSSRNNSLSCLRGVGPGFLTTSPSCITITSEAGGVSQLNSPAGKDPGGHGRRGMMQAIKNERRASKVLGIVFFLFLIMWCPFFICNVTMVICQSYHNGCNVPLLEELLDVFVWVGYISSGVNPLVYTLFNKTYRRAFSSYIRCRYKPHQHTSISSTTSCNVATVVVKAPAHHHQAPPLLTTHAATPVLCGDGAKLVGGVDRNSNCRNGGADSVTTTTSTITLTPMVGGNGSVRMRVIAPDDATDDETEYGGILEEEEEEEEEAVLEVVMEAARALVFNGNGRPASENTSSV